MSQVTIEGLKNRGSQKIKDGNKGADEDQDKFVVFSCFFNWKKPCQDLPSNNNVRLYSMEITVQDCDRHLPTMPVLFKNRRKLVEIGKPFGSFVLRLGRFSLQTFLVA